MGKRQKQLDSTLGRLWPVWVGLGLYWNWFWFFIVKPTGQTPGTHWTTSGLPDRALVITAALIAFVVARLCNRDSPSSHKLIAGLAVGYVFFGMFSLIPAIPQDLSSPLIHLLAGALVSMLFEAWGSLLSALGPRQTILVSLRALAVAIVCGVAIFLLGSREQTVLLYIVPLASCMLLFFRPPTEIAIEPGRPTPSRQSASDNTSSAALRSHTGIPWRFVSTLVVQGFAIGLWHFLFEFVVLEKCPRQFCIWRELANLFSSLGFIDFVGFASILGFGLAIVLVLFAVNLLQSNYRRLIYQIGIPFMALAFLFVAFDRGIIISNGSHMTGDVFVVGEILYTAGYFFILAIVQAMCASLVAKGKISAPLIFSLVGFLLFLGQTLGYLAGMGANALSISGTDICLVAVFILLVSCLFTIPGDSIWGNVGEEQPVFEETIGSFKKACMQLANEHGLTPRETEVFNLLAHGRTPASIQGILVISKDTVKAHTKSIYRKMDVHSQQELISVVEEAATAIRIAKKTDLE